MQRYKHQQAIVPRGGTVKAAERRLGTLLLNALDVALVGIFFSEV